MIESLESRIAPATFTVTSLADAGGGSLRDAVAAANDAPGADIIVFKKGLTGSIELATGEIMITDTLAIKGPGAAKLVIDAQQDSRIFRVLDDEGESPLSVSGLTFIGGTSGAGEDGGAILSSESLKVANCVFKNNRATGQGGAIAVFDGGNDTLVNADIRNSVFIANLNETFDGGAVNLTLDGSAVVKNCIFTNNVSNVRDGALAIDFVGGGQGLVEKCQFFGNTAPESGALGISMDNGKVNIVGNVFAGNQATVGGGGAIGVFGFGDTVFDRNLVSQNSSFQQGGGLFIAQFTSLKISNSRFLDNVSQLSGFFTTGGGAISIGGDQPGGSTAQIIGSIISGNRSERGGGIYVEDATFPLKIVGTKILANHSGTEGGGIFVDSEAGTDVSASVALLKSTVSGNIADNLGGGVYASGTGAFTVESSKVTQNRSALGGGLYLGNTAPVSISGSLIAQNYTVGFGGGIAAFAELDLRGTKIVGNTSGGLGGGVYSIRLLEVVDCKISGNFAVAGGGIFQQSPDPLTVTRAKVIGNISNDGKQIVDA